MVFKSLGRCLCIVQGSYLSKPFYPEEDSGVIIMFLMVIFRAEGRVSWSILLPFILPLHLFTKIAHFANETDFFRRWEEQNLCSGVFAVCLLSLGTTRKPALVKGFQNCFVFWVTAVLGGEWKTLLFLGVDIFMVPVLVQVLAAWQPWACFHHPSSFMRRWEPSAVAPGTQCRWRGGWWLHATTWDMVQTKKLGNLVLTFTLHTKIYFWPETIIFSGVGAGCSYSNGCFKLLWHRGYFYHAVISDPIETLLCCHGILEHMMFPWINLVVNLCEGFAWNLFLQRNWARWAQDKYFFSVRTFDAW